jgi:hypothetical protein
MESERRKCTEFFCRVEEGDDISVITEKVN